MGLLSGLMLLPGLVIGLTLQEFAHAWSASLLGDDLARRQKRVSLNPLRQMSALGTLALFVIHFGWGKPVPVNLYNFKHPRRDYLITSLAGPVTNLLIAGVAILLMLLTRRTYAFGGWGVLFLGLAHVFLSTVVVINVILAAINLLPIPPLDGSKIWPCVIPGLKAGFGKKTTTFFVIVLLVLLYSGSLGGVLGGLSERTWSILPETDNHRVTRLVDQGSAAADGKRHDEAVRHFTAALAIYPDNLDSLCGRAFSLIAQGHYEKALADVVRAIELTPGVPAFHELRAEIRQATGEPEEEVTADYERAEVLRGSPAAWRDVEAARRDNRPMLDRLKGIVTQLDLSGFGLGDALLFFCDATALPVRVDWDALKQAGLTPRTPVHVREESATFRKWLRQMLIQANPDEPVYYGVNAGEIVIPAGAEGGTRLKASLSESDPSDED